MLSSCFYPFGTAHYLQLRRLLCPRVWQWCLSVHFSRFPGLSFQTDTHLLKEVGHGHEWRGPRQSGAPERMTGATCVGHVSGVKSKMAWMIHIVSFLHTSALCVFCMKWQNASAQSLAEECPSQYHPPAFYATCPECEAGCQGDRAHVTS